MSEISRYYAGCGVLQTPNILLKSEVFTMTEKDKELIALFRYGLIAPLLLSVKLKAPPSGILF